MPTRISSFSLTLPCKGEGPDEHERNCHINREFDPIRGVNDMIIVQSKTLYNSGFRLLLFVSTLDRLLISQSATEVIDGMSKYIKRRHIAQNKNVPTMRVTRIKGDHIITKTAAQAPLS